MSAENIKEMLNEIGLQYEYDHFSTHNWIEPPFIVWKIPESDNFHADGFKQHINRPNRVHTQKSTF